MTSLLNNMVCDGLCVRCRSFRQLVYDSVNKRRLRSWNSSLKLVSLLLLQRYETKTRRLETSVLGYWTTKSQWVNWQWEILHSWKKQLTLLVAYLAGLLKVSLDWLRDAVYILWKSLKSFNTLLSWLPVSKGNMSKDRHKSWLSIQLVHLNTFLTTPLLTHHLQYSEMSPIYECIFTKRLLSAPTNAPWLISELWIYWKQENMLKLLSVVNIHALQMCRWRPGWKPLDYSFLMCFQYALYIFRQQ